MSTVKSNNVQIGQSLTATNNFTWYQPATPDGTVRLGNGNSGSVTDLVTLTSAGNLGIGTSSPGVKLQVDSGATGIYAVFNSTNANGGYFSGTSSGTTVWDIGTAKQALNVGGSLDFGLNVRNGFMAFGTGNTERMRLDSSGNLGLGVTPSGWYSSWRAFDLGAGAGFYSNGASNVALTANAYNSDGGGGWKYKGSGNANLFQTSSGQFLWYTAPSGTAGNAISFTQAMTLNASGNLLVGGTSTTENTTVLFAVAPQSGTTYVPVVTFGVGGTLGVSYQGGWRWYTSTGNGGSVYKNGYNLQLRVYDVGSGSEATAATVTYQSWYQGNNSANWATTSDARLKDNIRDIDIGLQQIIALRPVRFDWKEDSQFDAKDVAGFIAQDVEAIMPEMVMEAPDGFKSLNLSALSPAIVKAIQELHQEIQELKAKVNA